MLYAWTMGLAGTVHQGNMTHRFWLTLLVLGVWPMPLAPAQAAIVPSPGHDATVRLSAAPTGGQVGDGTREAAPKARWTPSWPAGEP